MTLPALLTVVSLAAGTVQPAVPASAQPAQPAQPVLRAADRTWSGTLAEGVAALPTAAERRAGYDRDLFEHWVDADGDGCDARDEVLLAEAREEPEVGSSCSLEGGSWWSSYDHVTTSDPSTFDVDHVVALAEAWDSGARRWDDGTRRRFANDLGDTRSLAAVSASSNRSKSDDDPAEWLPTYSRCTYARHWVAVKLRWSLRADRTEKAALRRLAARCGDRTLHVRRARVVTEG